MPTNTIAEREWHLLASYAMHSADSQGRRYAEPPHAWRGPFQRDRDRIVHTAAFRRLSGKTQVFTGQGDYHRTRLTHTMEVASIARTIGRALRLNEDLIEALALLHDIGHPPFGHAGEEALDEFLRDEGGFSHNRFALTLVEELEQRYPHCPGINLTEEVLCGQRVRIDKQDATESPLLEVQVVDLADSITYDAHDVDDAVELGWLELEQLAELHLVEVCQRQVTHRFGNIEGAVLRRAVVRELINVQVEDLIEASMRTLHEYAGRSALEIQQAGLRLAATDFTVKQKRQLEAYLYQHLYRHVGLVSARGEAQSKIKTLATTYVSDEAKLPAFFRLRSRTHGLRTSIVDYLAGMTDRFFLEEYAKLTG